MKKLIHTAVAAAAVALAAQAAPAYAKAKPELLKVPVAFATSLPALGSPIAWVEERIQKVSGK